MIKLKDILLENDDPNIFIPRRIEGRVERMIKIYIRNGSKGNLSLNRVGLTKLPDILKDITVGGSFDWSYNNLTSLENCPKTVGGNFGCGFNNLTSLEGSPSSVGGNFDCYNNNLTSLEGAPSSVGEDFNCNDNHLTSLENCPKTVGGSFGCSFNKLTSLAGAPKIVDKDFHCRMNTVQLTKDQVRAVCDVKGYIFLWLSLKTYYLKVSRQAFSFQGEWKIELSVWLRLISVMVIKVI